LIERKENTSIKNLCTNVSFPRNVLIFVLLRFGSCLSVKNERIANNEMNKNIYGKATYPTSAAAINAQITYARLAAEKYNPNTAPLVCFLLCLRMNA